MNSPAEKILYRKAALIFEELGFLMPQSDFCIAEAGSEPCAIVRFTGSFKGNLQVSIGGETLSILVANMLGQQGNIDLSMKKDALREISNVICGNALPALYGVKEVFHLDAPVYFDNTQSVQSISDSEFECIARIAIPFDSGQANLFLSVEPCAVDIPIEA